jgi:hypothetical protein
LGRLIYGTSAEIVFDDRVLAHLQVVIGTKLRRRESFFFSWDHDGDLRHGRSVTWLHESIPVMFRFSSAARHRLNRPWLDSMVISSNSAQGLVLTAEPPVQLEEVFPISDVSEIRQVRVRTADVHQGS